MFSDKWISTQSDRSYRQGNTTREDGHSMVNVTDFLACLYM